MMRQATYKGVVRQFNASTGEVTCIVPQLYGTSLITVNPRIARRSDIALISPLLPGDNVYVMSTGGDDDELMWIPTLTNGLIGFSFSRTANQTMPGSASTPIAWNNTLVNKEAFTIDSNGNVVIPRGKSGLYYFELNTYYGSAYQGTGSTGIKVLGSTLGTTPQAFAANEVRTITNTITFTPQANRLYRIRCGVRAAGGVGAYRLNLVVDGTALGFPYEQWAYASGNFQGLTGEWLITGDNVSHTYNVVCSNYTVAQSVYLDLPSAFYVEDMGSNSNLTNGSTTYTYITNLTSGVGYGMYAVLNDRLSWSTLAAVNDGDVISAGIYALTATAVVLTAYAGDTKTTQFPRFSGYRVAML